jgi:CopG family nickel-responsive transcriptional regulator
MERISISLPEKLLKEFDRILEEKGYASRSEGIRNALRGYMLEHRFLSGVEGEIAGTITMVYDHEEPKVLQKLTDFQHRFSDIIDSSLHIHLDERHCLEVIVVRGESGKIITLVNRLSSTRGVKHTKLTTNTSEILE